MEETDLNADVSLGKGALNLIPYIYCLVSKPCIWGSKSQQIILGILKLTEPAPLFQGHGKLYSQSHMVRSSKK